MSFEDMWRLTAIDGLLAVFDEIGALLDAMARPRRKRASKGWRKHIRRTKAAERNGVRS